MAAAAASGTRRALDRRRFLPRAVVAGIHCTCMAMVTCVTTFILLLVVQPRTPPSREGQSLLQNGSPPKGMETLRQLETFCTEGRAEDRQAVLSAAA